MCKFRNPDEVWDALGPSTQQQYKTKSVENARSVYKDWLFRRVIKSRNNYNSLLSGKRMNVQNENLTDVSMQRIKWYVPKIVLRTIDNEICNPEWLDENRNACIVFIHVALKLSDLCQEYEIKALNLLANIVQFVQTNVLHYGGVLDSIIIYILRVDSFFIYHPYYCFLFMNHLE